MNDNHQISPRSGLTEVWQALDRLLVRVNALGVAQKSPLLLAGLLICMAVASALPTYSRFSFAHGFDPLASCAMEWKFQHPLLPIPVNQIAVQTHCETEHGMISHMEKVSYRLLVPILGHVFGFGATGALVFQQFLACLFLLLVLLTFREIFPDKLSALFASMVVATSFPGQWGFSDFLFFDGFAYFFIGLALWVKSPWVLAGAVFAGGLSDERVILATPMLWLWLSLRHGDGVKDPNAKGFFHPRAGHFGLLAGIFLFCIIRLCIALKWGSAYESSMTCSFNIIKKCLHFLSIAALTGYKGGVLVFAVFFALLAARRWFRFLGLMVCAMFPSLLAAIMVFDLSRSLYYTYPALFIALLVISQQCPTNECRRITFCALLGSILFPTCFIMPFDIKLLNY